TFTILAYTGAPMRIAGFYTPVIVELSGMRTANPRIPIFLDHDPGRVIGQANAIEIDGSGVRLQGTITGDDDDSRKVLTHAKNGFQWEASGGWHIARSESLKAGESATVNGRDVSGPMLI